MLKPVLFLEIAQTTLRLGESFLHGKGINQDEKKALECFLLSSTLGNAWAQVRASQCYRYAKGALMQPEKAYHFAKLAADQKHAHGMCLLGEYHAQGFGTDENKDAALSMYRASAQLGNTMAVYNLALCHEKGYGTLPNPSLAFHYCKAAAKREYPPAFFLLGRYYYRGVGVPVDMEQAFEWFELASHSGDMCGKCYLASMYWKGQGGVDQNLALTATLFYETAVQGYPDGEFNYGLCLAHGIGVERDVEQSLEYIRRAAFKGHTESLQYLANNEGDTQK